VSLVDPLSAEQERLLSQGRSTLRDLPWRRTRDPWSVLVSEVMLQQTQAARVVQRWERFLELWPTPIDCASAPLGDVLREWQGLGYPRRARSLWLAARFCVDQHGGALPDTLDGLLALPGVGAYTARAVMAFAFERDIGVVETNIARVLARRAGDRLTPSAAQSAADALVPAQRSWEWNQMLMDLGAHRCRPEPRCDGCPMQCRWRDAGWPDPDPADGSAGVSRRQARFAGSDRQLRGRVLAALSATSPLTVESLELQLVGPGCDRDRLARVLSSLAFDELLSIRDDSVRLP